MQGRLRDGLFFEMTFSSLSYLAHEIFNDFNRILLVLIYLKKFVWVEALRPSQ